eukprot:1315673-Lingulodinium_polyedra.AAC.1
MGSAQAPASAVLLPDAELQAVWTPGSFSRPRRRWAPFRNEPGLRRVLRRPHGLSGCRAHFPRRH